MKLLLVGLLGVSASAGQIEVPAAVEVKTGNAAGTIGGSLAAPSPLQLNVPSISAAPTLAPSLAAPAPAPTPQAVAARPVPVLPASAVTPAAPAILATEPKAAKPADAGEQPDPGRALFDQGGTGPLVSVSRGASRAEGWVVNGRPARRLSAGGFKEVLIHPSDPNRVIKLFALAGAKDTAGSLAEKRRELRNMEPLLAIQRTPKVVEQGALELTTPADGKKAVGFIVQERVDGSELGDLLADKAAAAKALSRTRQLFEELIAARIKLEDRTKMLENIKIGRSGGNGPVKAWVLDAGETSLVPAPGLLDKLRGKPDPLRVYYEGLLAQYSRRAGI